jgi:hypothetical protein
MREDVKKKILPSPFGGDVGVVTYIQTHLILRGVLGLSALDRRAFQRRYQPQLLVSGRTMARIGLRMMPPFPSSPLRFRTVSFPQSGSKAGISDGAFPSSARNFATCGLHPPFVHLAALTSYPRSKSRDAVR